MKVNRRLMKKARRELQLIHFEDELEREGYSPREIEEIKKHGRTAQNLETYQEEVRKLTRVRNHIEGFDPVHHLRLERKYANSIKIALGGTALMATAFTLVGTAMTMKYRVDNDSVAGILAGNSGLLGASMSVSGLANILRLSLTEYFHVFNTRKPYQVADSGNYESL